MDEIKDALINDLNTFNEDEYEGQVFKRAKGGCCFNRRYLSIRSGLITYYREQPHSFNFSKSSSADSSKPKGQVSSLISSFKLVPSSFLSRKSHKFSFEISFVPESLSLKKKRIFWVFSVRTEEILMKWKNAFESAKLWACQEEDKRLQEEKKISEQVAEEQKNRALRDENLRKAKEQEKIKAKARQMEKIVEEEKRKKDIDDEKKRIQEEAEEKKKTEEARKRKENYSRLLEDSWDYKFQKHWSEILKNCENFENSLEISLEILKTVGIFLSRAEKAVKVLVNQKALSESDRFFIPLSLEDPPCYLYNDSFHITLISKSSNPDHWKRLGHEQRANSSMFDVLHFAGKHENSSFPFRVPLMCLVDFKGFRALVVALMPIEDERTLIHGPRADGSFVVSQGLYEQLAIVAEMMNLKEHVFEWNSRLGPVYTHLSYFLEMHKTTGYKDLEDFVRENLGEDTENDISLENLVYFRKVAEVLPVDHSDIEQSPDFLKRLRPEFFQTYQQTLCSDCFVNKHLDSQKNDFEVIQACRSLQFERVEKLVEELDSLENIIVDSRGLTKVFHDFGVNMRYLSKVLEKSSIFYIQNLIRIEILSRSCKSIFFQHLSETIEEYSKSPKPNSIPNRSLSILDTLQTRRQSMTSTPLSRRLSSLSLSKLTNNSRYSQELNTGDFLDQKSESLLQECILDYFNLVFGNDVESSLFWDEILLPFCISKFQCNVLGLGKNEIHLNALLFAMIFHCGLEIDFSSDLLLGKTAKPFQGCKVTVLTKVKEYKLASLECKALADKFAFFRNQEMLDSALQAAELKVRMSIALSLDESPLGDSEALLDYAEVLMDKGELEKGIVKVKEALVQVHPLNARSAACWNLLVKGLFLMELNEESLQAFDQGLTCLNFHWGQNHPFACLLANRLAELHARKMNFREALDLMKFSLLVCMKTIGPNHVFTAGVNMKIGQIQQSCGNPEISASYLEKAYLVFEAYHGLGSLITGKSAATLSEVLVSLGRYQEARKLISTSCQVYQSYLDKNDEVRASLFEKSKILNEFYFACLVGLVIGLKTNEFELVKIFADKLWTIISQSEDPDFMIVLQIIEYVLKAKLNLLGAKKTAKLNYFVTVKAKIQDTDLEAIKTNFLSPSFLISVECKGGIVTFIEKLVDKVSFYSDLSEKDINWLKLESSVSELKAMMEINTQICN